MPLARTNLCSVRKHAHSGDFETFSFSGWDLGKFLRKNRFSKWALLHYTAAILRRWLEWIRWIKSLWEGLFFSQTWMMMLGTFCFMSQRKDSDFLCVSHHSIRGEAMYNLPVGYTLFLCSDSCSLWRNLNLKFRANSFSFWTILRSWMLLKGLLSHRRLIKPTNC